MLLALSLLVNIIFIAGNSRRNPGNVSSASVLSWLGFFSPQPEELKDFKKAIYPCRMTDDVYVPYSTFEMQGGFITKTEINKALTDNPNVNGICYYYAVDNTGQNPMFDTRLFIIFNGAQKASDGRIINLNTPYHSTDMVCPTMCPE